MLRRFGPVIVAALLGASAHAQPPSCTDLRQPCRAEPTKVAWAQLSTDTLPHGVVEIFYDPASVLVASGLHRVTFRDVVRYSGMAGSTRQHQSAGDVYYRYFDCATGRTSTSVTPGQNVDELLQDATFWLEDNNDTHDYLQTVRRVMLEACRVKG